MRELTLADVGELGLIGRITSILGDQDVLVGIGDDAAVIEQPGREQLLLATVDTLVEDVHFRRDETNAPDVGRRALAVNVSDIAAMGGKPTFALTSLAASPDLPLEFVDGVYRGIRQEAQRFGVRVIGGNVARTAGPMVLDVTLLGEVPRDEVVLRRGAEVGDVLAVTGFLGDAAALRLLLDHPELRAKDEFEEFRARHAVPEPRVEAGRAVASRGLVHAMIDLSDGLAGDLHQLAAASEVGAVIYEDRLPVSSAARHVAEMSGTSPHTLALFGGEDYELLVALPEEAVGPARTAVGQLPLSVIGTVLPHDQGVLIERFGGKREPLAPAGWTHF